MHFDFLKTKKKEVEVPLPREAAKSQTGAQNRGPSHFKNQTLDQDLCRHEKILRMVQAAGDHPHRKTIELVCSRSEEQNRQAQRSLLLAFSFLLRVVSNQVENSLSRQMNLIYESSLSSTSSANSESKN